MLKKTALLVTNGFPGGLGLDAAATATAAAVAAVDKSSPLGVGWPAADYSSSLTKSQVPFWIANQIISRSILIDFDIFISFYG